MVKFQASEIGQAVGYFGQEHFPVTAKVMELQWPHSVPRAGAAQSSAVFSPIGVQLLPQEYECLNTSFGYLHTHPWHYL